jgi:catechol 2,3-dioxygenase-like lactoylglutathione lyase family enzyme
MIKGLTWLGVRTERYQEMKDFLENAAGLTVDHGNDDFVVFALPDGSKLELFGPRDADHEHFSTGPVAGFEVDDIEAARADLIAGGAEFFGPIHRWEPTGEAWSHFRAPDGNVYELTYRPKEDRSAQ